MRNPQLQTYALAALEQFGLAEDFQTVRIVIHQPRLNHVSEAAIPVDELLAFGETLSAAAKATRLPDAPLVVSEKGCKYCKAKATCPAIRDEVLGHFDNVEPTTATTDELGEAMAKADLIEGWVKAIRAETERRLFAGTPVAGFKLVQGKRGNRAWTDVEEAEKLLKSMKLKHDQLYEYKVISPTTADKLATAGAIGPRQWFKVLALITQADGKPSVAPEADKRPALVTSAEADFDDVTDLT